MPRLQAVTWGRSELRLKTTQPESVVTLVGFICILTAPFWVYNLFLPFPSGFEAFLGLENDLTRLLWVFVLVLVVQIALMQKVSAGDRFVSEVMVVGFLFKLAAVSAYMFMAFRVYEGTADSLHYFGEGQRIADEFSLTGNWTLPGPLWNNNSIIMLAGILINRFGPSVQALMIIFATISYWGQYLLFRAFCIAFPNGQHKVAALFLFFLPSIAFWTAPIGKDSIIFFFIGACCYGFAKLRKTIGPKALVTILLSLGGVLMVRPHIAALLAIAFGGAYLLSRNRTGLLGMAAKILGVPLLIFATVYLITQARTFVDLKDVGQTQDVLKHVGRSNQFGGSAFGSSFLVRVLEAPFLLFRPFPWEVRSIPSMIAGVEALGLSIFFWRNLQLVRSSIRNWRDNAFVIFSWIYALEFSLVFAGALTNFGTLVRQRVMLIPLALMIPLSQARSDLNVENPLNTPI
jgi:hypothetical protein